MQTLGQCLSICYVKWYDMWLLTLLLGNDEQAGVYWTPRHPRKSGVDTWNLRKPGVGFCNFFHFHFIFQFNFIHAFVRKIMPFCDFFLSKSRVDKIIQYAPVNKHTWCDNTQQVFCHNNTGLMLDKQLFTVGYQNIQYQYQNWAWAGMAIKPSSIRLVFNSNFLPCSKLECTMTERSTCTANIIFLPHPNFFIDIKLGCSFATDATVVSWVDLIETPHATVLQPKTISYRKLDENVQRI